ncbi:hypothetical protein H0H87_001572, partial [Tephrocybe sp. NHM501043]
RNGNHHSPISFPNLHRDTLKALASLPNRFLGQSEKKNYHSVLRGLIVFPATSSKGLSDAILEKVSAGCIGYDPDHEFFHVALDSLYDATKSMKPYNGLRRHVIAIRMDEDAKEKEAKIRKNRKNAFARPYGDIRTLKLAEILPFLIVDIEDLMSLDDDQIKLQLELHRRMEKIMWGATRGGSVEYQTPLPELGSKESRLMAASEALIRWEDIQLERHGGGHSVEN